MAHSHFEPGSHSHLSAAGVSAVRNSFIILFFTASLQLAIAVYSGSISLLADTVHNYGDVVTSFPLWIAFRLAERPPSARFRYGYGRVEDLAGILVVLIILASAVVAGYLAIDRLLHPQEVTHLWYLSIGAIIGFIGNESVAQLRMKAGREMDSAALIADGLHARTDGWVSLAVLGGVIGTYFGFPLADPLIGIGITIAILFIVWESGHTVFVRILDAIEPEIVTKLEVASKEVEGVHTVTDVRARWFGHRLIAELSVGVQGTLSVEQGHAIAKQVQKALFVAVPQLNSSVIHVDPESESGDSFHSHLPD